VFFFGRVRFWKDGLNCTPWRLWHFGKDSCFSMSKVASAFFCPRREVIARRQDFPGTRLFFSLSRAILASSVFQSTTSDFVQGIFAVPGRASSVLPILFLPLSASSSVSCVHRFPISFTAPTGRFRQRSPMHYVGYIFFPFHSSPFYYAPERYPSSQPVEGSLFFLEEMQEFFFLDVLGFSFCPFSPEKTSSEVYQTLLPPLLLEEGVCPPFHRPGAHIPTSGRRSLFSSFNFSPLTLSPAEISLL